MPWEEDLDRSCSMKSLQGYNQDVTQNGDGAFSHKCVHLSYSINSLGKSGSVPFIKRETQEQAE